MNRTIFDSMRPKEVSREQLKCLLKGESIQVYDLFKMVGFVESRSDFKRQVKDGGLSIEKGHLNFEKVKDLEATVNEKDFIQDRLLLLKGKTQHHCIKL